jgi:predicted RNA-binding protein with RPS1 domain
MSSTPEPSSTPPEGTPPEGTAESQPGIQSEQHSAQHSAEGDSGQGAENAQPRRIPIGTQRPGVKPPRPAPRYEYFSAPAPAATAGLQTSGLAAPVLAASGQAAPAAVAATPPVVETPGAPAAAAPAADGAKGQNTPGQPAPGHTAAPRREGRRDKRGGSSEKSPFKDVLPPQKRVAVPNLRAALDDDLEQDFEAALAGVAIDDLITASTSARADAPLEPGARLAGTVLSIGADTAFIDLGERRQGAMKLAGLDLELVPAVGDVLQLSVGLRNDDDGLYDVAFANRAVAVEDWSQIQAGMIVEARVTAANKGGLECDVAGLRGFMPASLVSTWRVENLEEMVGQTLESLVTDIVPAARRLVLSRRAVIEKTAAEAKTKLLETLEVGTMLDGTVRSVRDFGAFVDIGEGVEGLVHVSQLSWDRVANPADVLQPGQRVRVVVKKIDRDTGKIGLSARDLVESPWQRAGDKYHVGATVRGVVSRIAQFGAFVKLEPGVEGLVHVSELANRHVRSVGDVVKEGEPVECRVLSIDPEEQRMSLSIKAMVAPSAAASPDDAADEDAAAEEAPAAPVVKKHTGVLKGGTGRVGNKSAGEKFGLKW